MKKSKSPHPKWALKYRKPGTELRCIQGRYYLYLVSSFYDTDKKRSIKKTGKLLGRITKEEGFIDSEKYKLKLEAEKKLKFTNIQTKEYGLTKFIGKFGNETTLMLKKHFPEYWKEILLITYCRFGYNSPIKNMPFHIGKSFMSELYEITLTDKKISSLLREIGKRRDLIVKYMQSFVQQDDHILVDMTNVFSSSSKIPLVRAGYNSDLIFDSQFNLMYIYSMNLRSPVFYRIYGGNIKDVKGFKTILEESGISDAIIIADKGFYSECNINLLDESELRYIIPMRRSNKHIEYDKIVSDKIKTDKNYFKHENRYIWYYSQEKEEKKIHIYLDDRLKNMEETDYLNRVSSHPEEYTIEKYHQKKERFGTIGIYTNILSLTEKEVYEAYKSRVNIEVMFDGMKNILDCDKTYMQDEDALQGWMFINHLALQLYHRMYLMIKEKEIINKYSVSDMITHMKEIRKVKIGDEWRLEAITSSTEKMMTKLGLPITYD